MSYFKSRIGNIVCDGQIVPMDESSELYQAYKAFLDGGGFVEPTEDLLPVEQTYLNKERTKARYQLHRKNGWDAYQDFRADIVERIANEELTEEMAFLIEFTLGPAYDRISDKGDWKTALYVLQQVSAPQGFVQPFIDSAIQIIEEYINKNYEA